MTYRIQDVLQSAQDAAPPPRTTTDEIIARAGRIRTRRRLTVVAGGVAACLALSAAAFAGLGPAGTGTQQTAASPSFPPEPSASAPAPVSSGPAIQPSGFRTRIGAYQVGQYLVGPNGQVAPGYQTVAVYRDGQTWPADDGTKYPLSTGTVTVYQKGVYDPVTFGGTGDDTRVVGPQYQVKVGGKAGIGRDITFYSPVDKDSKWVRASVAWQYAPKAWATFVPDYDKAALTRADAAAIAAGLKLARGPELRVPYRLDYLPEGWRTVAVTQRSAEISNEVSKVFLHDGPLTESAATPVDEVFPHSVIVTVSKGDPKDEKIRGRDGVHCYPGRQDCVIVHGAYLIGVSSWTGALPDAEVRKIAQGVRLLDIADQSSWVTVGR